MYENKAERGVSEFLVFGGKAGSQNGGGEVRPGMHVLPVWREECGWIVGTCEVRVLGVLSKWMLKCLRMTAEDEVERKTVSPVVRFLRSMMSISRRSQHNLTIWISERG